MIKRFLNKGIGNITVNGKTFSYSGDNIAIIKNKVIVDGEEITTYDNGVVDIFISGDVGSLECSGSVKVSGNTKDITCGGSCTVKGNVDGSVSAGGSITCGNVAGNINAGGNVSCRR